MTAIHTNTETQRDRLKNLLLALKPDITATDRQDCVEECEISEPSLKRYLTGNIGDNDKAVELVKFFKHRIAQRDKAIIAA